MNDPSTFWLLTCQTVKNHAQNMSSWASNHAKILIDREAKAFCDRNPPSTEGELSQRQRESLHLISKIGMISHADTMAKSNPKVASRIYLALDDFLEGVPLHESPHDKSMKLLNEISSICHGDLILQQAQ